MSSAERTLFQRLTRFPYAAGEAQAFMRRRRHGIEPFSRVRFADGRTVAHPPGTARSRTLFLAAADLIDIAPSRADRTVGGSARPRKDQGNRVSEADPGL